MLVDTGPLVALLDRNDAQHKACLRIVQGLAAGSLLTTWPCFTESFCLLSRVGGYSSQEKLWTMRRSNRLLVLDATVAEVDRMEALMTQYQSIPMDLGDASLVAMAESRGYHNLFTIDSDFYIYRLADGSVLKIVH